MDNDHETDSRTRGVDFGAVDDELERLSYPVAKSELLSACGQCDLDLERARMTLREVLEPHGAQTYDSKAHVVRAVLAMVGEDAVGREGYSDRGGRAPGIDDSDPPV